MGKAVAFYGDFIDPFCYIGYKNLMRAADKHQTPIIWKGFEMNVDTPAEGLDLHRGENSDLHAAMWATVTQMAIQSGLEFKKPPRVPNTFLAHSLLKMTPNLNVKKLLIDRIYHAYFQCQIDIGSWDMLSDLMKDLKYTTQMEKKDIHFEAIHAELEKNRSAALRHQFLGMPGFQYRQKTYFGPRKQAEWEKILETH